jgi:3-hydroxybutyryl-CoA dehydratase
MSDVVPKRSLSRSFDDLVEGARFSTSWRIVGTPDVDAFAELTGDHHPQHTDASFAAASSFGKRIAHGMLVLSYAVGLVDFDPAYVVALRRVGDAVFKRPLAIGEAISVQGRIVRLLPIDEQVGLVQCLWNIVNSEERCVVRVTVEIVWRRLPLRAGVAAARCA